MAEETGETRAKTLAMGLTAFAGAIVLVVLVARAAVHGPFPQGSVVVFAIFLLVASNVSPVWTPDIGVTPDLMVVMAAVAAFYGHAGVLSAAVVGFSGGFLWGVLTKPTRKLRRNVLMTAFNCGELALSAAAAAVAYQSVYHGSVAGLVLGAAAAAMAYAAVNVTLVLIMVVAGGVPPRLVWADMAPSLPNFFAFGIVGALVGQLYVTLGFFSLVLLVVPSLISRRTYRSSLVLREARASTIQVFMKALEIKDLYTARHTERVAKFACYMGEELGFRGNRLTDLRHAALMHDIGKLAVSGRLLNKPGRLTEGEYAEIRRHNEVCVEILTQVEFLRATIPVATDRHGHFGATAQGADRAALVGYMVAVADAFDAMTSTRAYRKALTQDVAFSELRKGKGTQFDPGCVDALIAVIERRGETYGHGHEVDLVQFEVEPPAAGVGSAGLGDLERPPAPEVAPDRSGASVRFPFAFRESS
jgi:hypothetical protein